jgi:hypothetical protein
MIPDIDPLFSLVFILFQVGNRYLKINITKAQEEILKHPFMQIMMYFSIIYYSTKNITLSFFISIITLLLYNILLNENSQYNLLSEKWLNEKQILKKPLKLYKDVYKSNMQNLHID